MGCGEAGSKEEAQGKAAEMFCNLLVEKRVVDRRELTGGSGGQNLVPAGVGGQFFRPPAPPRLPPPTNHYNSNFQQNSRGCGKSQNRSSLHWLSFLPSPSPSHPVYSSAFSPSFPNGCSSRPLPLINWFIPCLQLRRYVAWVSARRPKLKFENCSECGGSTCAWWRETF